MSNNPTPRRGLLLVISSPSGAGKSSLSRRLVLENEGLTLSVSATTRNARPGEQHGREYLFLSDVEFSTMVADEAFLEWADVHEHRYGSPRAPVMQHLEAGRDVLFDIDWQGAQSISREAGQDTVKVFILPPTMADLAKRLHTRAQDADDVISRRLGRARGEIEHWIEYDYVIVNDDFERAYGQLSLIYQAERERRSRNLWLASFVDRLLLEP